MDSTITFEMLIKLAGIIAAAWAFYKIIMEIVKVITNRHDREQKWDEVANLETAMTEKYNEDQRKKWKDYDMKIDETNKRIQKIDEKLDLKHKQTENMIEQLTTDTDAKMQEIKAELCILTESVSAILDGLKQLNCNGPVTEAKNKLDQYMIDQAHK